MDMKERERKEKLENFPKRISLKSSMLGGGWNIQNKKEENARTFPKQLHIRPTISHVLEAIGPKSY
jgi:hypothetical protein